MADEKPKKAKTCEQHPDQPAAAQCGACGKFICRDCIKQFGYYCSAACLEQSRGSVTAEAKEESKRAQSQLDKAAKIGKLIVLGMALLFIMFAAWLTWKFWLDPSGKICWQWSCDVPLHSMAVLAHDERQITVLAQNQVVVLDTKTGTLVRSFDVPDDRPRPTAGTKSRKPTTNDDEDSDEAEDETEDMELQRGGFGLGFSFGFGGPPLIVLNDGSLLKIGANQVSRVTPDGATKYSKSYEEGSVAHVQVSPDHTTAYYVSTAPVDLAAAKAAKKELKAAMEEHELKLGGSGEGEIPHETPDSLKALARMKAAQAILRNVKVHIVALNIESGNQLWTKKMKKNVSLYSCAAGADHFIGFFMAQPKTAEDEDGAAEPPAVKWTLCALNAADGRIAWQAKMDDHPDWGPRIEQGVTLLRMGSDLQAIAEDGTEKYTLSIPTTKSDSDPDIFVRNGLLFVVGKRGARCYDLDVGTEKWGIAMAFDESDLLVATDRIYVSGYVEEARATADMKLPPAYEELKKTDADLFKGIGSNSGAKMVGVMVALDRDTGTELWKLNNTYGWPRGDDKRFLLIADTARTSQMEMLTGGEGITVIRQFSARGGKQLYMRRNQIGFAEPVLIGDRLIGLAYERTRRASILNPGGGDGDDQPTRGIGVVAFKVR